MVKHVAYKLVHVCGCLCQRCFQCFCCLFQIQPVSIQLSTVSVTLQHMQSIIRDIALDDPERKPQRCIGIRGCIDTNDDSSGVSFILDLA